MATKNLVDDDLHTHRVLIVKPVGRFSRKSPDAVPKDWRATRWLTFRRGHERKHEAQQAIYYNRRAIACGWSTWAIVYRDESLHAVARAAELAKIERRGLDAHGLRVYVSRELFGKDDHAYYISFDANVSRTIRAEGLSARDLRRYVLAKLYEAVIKMAGGRIPVAPDVIEVKQRRRRRKQNAA